MEVYVYAGNAPLGQEPLGTEGRHIWRDLTTLKGAIQRARALYPSDGFMVYTFTNFFNDATFKLQHREPGL
jgi:hypothetical protein